MLAMPLQELPNRHTQYLDQFLIDHAVNIQIIYLKASENSYHGHPFAFPFAVIPRVFVEGAC
jgi:hypothetical protein